MKTKRKVVSWYTTVLCEVVGGTSMIGADCRIHWQWSETWQQCSVKESSAGWTLTVNKLLILMNRSLSQYYTSFWVLYIMLEVLVFHQNVRHGNGMPGHMLGLFAVKCPVSVSHCLFQLSGLWSALIWPLVVSLALIWNIDNNNDNEWILTVSIN